MVLPGSAFAGGVRPVAVQEVPADEHLVLEAAVAPGGESQDLKDTREEQGTADENELLDNQQPLISEDKATALKLEGFPEEEVPDILGAMGDDAEEVTPDYGNGLSATGEWNTPEHGGFPDRNE